MANVSYCGLEEQTLTLLLRSVRANCSLQVLKMEGNNLTGKGTFILSECVCLFSQDTEYDHVCLTLPPVIGFRIHVHVHVQHVYMYVHVYHVVGYSCRCYFCDQLWSHEMFHLQNCHCWTCTCAATCVYIQKNISKNVWLHLKLCHLLRF